MVVEGLMDGMEMGVGQEWSERYIEGETAGSRGARYEAEGG